MSSAGGRGAGRWGELGPRIVSAAVLMILALGVTGLGGRAFDVFWLVASWAILWEWQTLIAGGRRPARMLIGGLALAVAALLTVDRLPMAALAALVAGAAILATAADPGKRALSGFGVVYAGALILAVTVLRQSFPYATEAIFWLFAVVWGTDCMAYFAGRLIGGPKLYPRFSPSKTWSGFLAGIACGSLLGLLVSPDIAPVAPMLLLGLAAGAVAQGGDLFESALKRRVGAKDSGHLIPGHGGVMDRLDGFLASSVFAACLGTWRFGADASGLGLFHW